MLHTYYQLYYKNSPNNNNFKYILSANVAWPFVFYHLTDVSREWSHYHPVTK